MAGAASLLVVLQDRLPDDLLSQLVRARRRGADIEVLFHGFREGAYLHQLHGTGMRLFESAMSDAEPSALFIDRHEGYVLPAWSPIENAFSRAYRLLWRRLGAVMEVEGRVRRVTSEDPLVELDAPRPVFVNVSGLASRALLREGRSIRALGVVAFMGMGGMSILLDALHIEPTGDITGSFA